MKLLVIGGVQCIMKRTEGSGIRGLPRDNPADKGRVAQKSTADHNAGKTRKFLLQEPDITLCPDISVVAQGETMLTGGTG